MPIFLIIWLALPFYGTGTLTYQAESMDQCISLAEQLVPSLNDSAEFYVTKWACKSQTSSPAGRSKE